MEILKIACYDQCNLNIFSIVEYTHEFKTLVKSFDCFNLEIIEGSKLIFCLNDWQ